MSEQKLLEIPLTKKQIKLLAELESQMWQMFLEGKPGSILAQVYPVSGFFKCVANDHEATALIQKAIKKYSRRQAKAKAEVKL